MNWEFHILNERVSQGSLVSLQFPVCKWISTSYCARSETTDLLYNHARPLALLFAPKKCYYAFLIDWQTNGFWSNPEKDDLSLTVVLDLYMVRTRWSNFRHVSYYSFICSPIPRCTIPLLETLGLKNKHTPNSHGIHVTSHTNPHF